MMYQLVIQWPASSIRNYDELTSIEDTLIDNLNDGSKVDGHDAGSGEVNIFIHTDNPRSTFNVVMSIVDALGFWADSRVAYREMTGDDYTILWPEGLYEFDIA